MNVIRRRLLCGRGTLPARVSVFACFASTNAKYVPQTTVSTPPWTPKGERTRPVILPGFEPTIIPKNADPKLYKSYFRRSEVHLIGTTHSDSKCNTDVQTAIRKLRPDGIFLEMPDTEGGRKMVLGAYAGWPSEFHLAYKEAKALRIPKNRIVLGDVPRETTRKRARYTGHDDEWKQFLTDNFDGRPPSEIPTLYKAMLHDRDLFMTHGLMKMVNRVAASEYSNAQRKGKAVRLIAVVDSAHVPGIRCHWGTHISDEKVKRLLMTPDEECWYLLKKAVLPAMVILILLVAYRHFKPDVEKRAVVAPAFVKALRPAVAESRSAS